MARRRLDPFQKKLFNSIAAEWRTTGRWPLSVDLQVRLSKDKPRRELTQVLNRIDRSLWEPRTNAAESDSTYIMLTPAGLELTDGGEAELQPLLALTHLAVRKRLEHPEKTASVSTADLASIIGTDDPEKLARVQEYCSVFWAAGHGASRNADGTRSWDADFQSIRYEHVANGGEYCALRSRHPVALNLDELGPQHRALLARIYQEAMEQGAPPRFMDFVLAHRQEGDVIKLVMELPYAVIEPILQPLEMCLDKHLKLRFDGYVLAAKDAEPALFARTLPVFLAHYEATPGRAAPISAKELAHRLDVPLERVLRLQPLFEGEGYTGTKLVPTGDSWEIHLDKRILGWRGVSLIDPYLRRRKRELGKTADESASEALAEMMQQPRPARRSPARRPRVTQSLEPLLRSRDLAALEADHQRTIKNLVSDPAAAIAAASSMLESLFKSIIEEEGLELPTEPIITKLWKVVQDHLGLDASVLTDADMKRMAGSLSGLMEAIGSLRTHGSTAHGRTARDDRMTPRHALLAVNGAHTLATFIIQSCNERNPPR